MSLFRSSWGPSAEEQVATRRLAGRYGAVNVTSDSALRHSAVWACLRLRADLISTMPIDLYRRINGVQVEMLKPRLLVSPSGERVDITEWMYASQMDLDRYGNSFGLITEVGGDKRPARIDLVAAGDVTVRVKDGEIFKYRIGGREYDPHEVWHEKQFTPAGFHVGLSPIAYAAWSIGSYLSAQQFSLDWFGSGATPSGSLKNTERTIDATVAAEAKKRFKSAVADRDVFVHGKDWDYNMISVPANESQFLEAMNYGVGDVCRFLGVPGDMIDADHSTGSITYASITQRNLQLLIVNIGPSVFRRERALTRAMPEGRYVKLNADATVLRMDAAARAELLATQVRSRTLDVDEARELDNRPPLTEEQIVRFERLFAKSTSDKETSK